DQLGLAEQDVRVITPDIGGGFGVKLHVYDDEMAVCAAAMLVARPVKYVCDRLEAFVSDIHARAHTVSVSAAVDPQGRIQARQLAMDPVEFRRLNLRREGATPTHVQAGGLSHEACLDRLLELMDYGSLRSLQKTEKSKGRHLGIGFATFVEQNAPGPAFYGA